MGKSLERFTAESVQAQVLEREDSKPCAVAVPRDGSAGKVQGASIAGAHHLDRVGRVELRGRARGGEGGNLAGVAPGLGGEHGREQRVEVFGAQQGLVALEINVDVRGNGLGDGVDTVGAAAAVLGREHSWEAEALRQFHNLSRVGRDQDLVERRAGAGGAVHPGEHGLARDRPEHFAGQAGRSKARGNDAEDAGGHGIVQKLTPGERAGEPF